MSTATADRVKELKGQLSTLVRSNQEVVDSFKMDENNTLQIPVDAKGTIDENMKSIREIRGLIENLTEQSEAEKWLGQTEGSVAGAANAAAHGSREAAELLAPNKTLGDLFLESPEFKALQNGRAGATMQAPFEVKAANIGSMWRGMHLKDVYSDMPTGTPGSFGPTQRDPMIDRNRRTARVRDLFPVQRTNATMIEYFRVTGFTNNAATVGQRTGDNTAFALKPQSTLAFQGEQAPIRTIAHWEAAHRHALADEPQLRGIIDNELLYGLRLVEDAQILSGNGVGENLRGILNTPGVQNYLWSSGATTPVPDTKADAIRRAATLAFLSLYQPTGVVVHPNDWEDIELTKNSGGDYLLAVSIALGGEQRVWRMPVVDSPAIPEGTALLGAFGIGAQLYDREEANIRVAEQHADFFIRNAIVVLAEERVGLAVKRPESFVEITFDNEPVPAP